MKLCARGRGNNSKKIKEPCCRFNKGRCTFGLSCKFEHHCSVPKCGKFGHVAHICRMRESGNAIAASEIHRLPPSDNASTGSK